MGKRKGSGWRNESRRHALAQAGVKTNINEERRFDVSSFVSRGIPTDEDFEIAERKLNNIRESMTEFIDDVIGSSPRMISQEDAAELRRHFNNIRTSDVMVSDNYIILSHETNKNWRYYVGFEYVDSDYIHQIGDYWVYDSQSERVQEVIDMLGGHAGRRD